MQTEEMAEIQANWALALLSKRDKEKNSLTSAGIEPMIWSSIALLTELRARWEQVLGNSGGNCGNMKSTNECCVASTKDTKGLQLVVYLIVTSTLSSTPTMRVKVTKDEMPWFIKKLSHLVLF